MGWRGTFRSIRTASNHVKKEGIRRETARSRKANRSRNEAAKELQEINGRVEKVLKQMRDIDAQLTKDSVRATELEYYSSIVWKWIRGSRRCRIQGHRFPIRTGILIAAAICLTSSVIWATPLNRLTNCTLVSTEWADGDSFLVRVAGREEHTVRLYGADCIEWHVTDESDARRLREQRRYFGITKAGGNPQESIRVAKGFGETAALEVRKLLKQPFTLFTAYSDARGDGKYKRIYGFIVTSDGRDLAEVLVEKGLARAYGVSRETYHGMTRDEYRERLKDLELIAAKNGSGVWGQTIWSNLPAERQEQREEEREISMATGDAPLISGEVLNPNEAARDELMRLPGIGETLANRIIEGRPYETLEDLLRVNGIGNSTFSKIKRFLKISSDL